MSVPEGTKWELRDIFEAGKEPKDIDAYARTIFDMNGRWCKRKFKILETKLTKRPDGLLDFYSAAVAVEGMTDGV